MKNSLHLASLAAFALAVGAAKAQCPAGQSQVTVSILTDNYPAETTWALTGLGGAPVYGSGGPYNGQANQNVGGTACVPNGPVIVFTINDSYGDGICCGFGQGNYTVTVGGVTVASGGQFTFQESTPFITSAPVQRDLACMSVNLNPVIAQGNTTIGGALRNFGTQAVTSFTLNYSINNGAAVSQNITANIAPGGTYTYSHGTPWNAPVGNHTVKVWATNINGSADQNTLNDELTVNVAVATQSVQRRTLLEGFTSSTCPPCASMYNWLTPALNNLNVNTEGSNVLSLKYQMNWPSPGTDPSYNPDGASRRTYYGVSGIPDNYLNGNGVGLTQANTASTLNNSAAQPAFVNVALTSTYTGNTVTVTASVTPFANFPGAHKLYIAALEDYSYTGGTTSQSQFKGVMRKMLPNGNGITLSNLQAGVTQTFTESYTFSGPPVTQNSHNLWGTIGGVRVIAFVQNTATREVLNAAFQAPLLVGIDEFGVVKGLNVFPNPTTGELFVEYELPAGLTAQVEVLDALGQRVLTTTASTGNGYNREVFDLSGVSDGVYLLNITAGGDRVSRRVVLAR
jgi:hypothetical protein